MNDFQAFLTRIITALEKAGIPYLITGSVGSSLYGEPRATRDIDFIIAPTEVQLKNFISEVETDYYANLDSALEAFRNRSMFNVIEGATGWKADLILVKNSPYEKEKFKRRLINVYQDVSIVVATPEDMILSKLVWARASMSEMQLRDVLGIVVTQKERLDRAYLTRWAKSLGVNDTLEKILVEAQKVWGEIG